MAYNINEYLDKEGLIILWQKIKDLTKVDDEINDSSERPVQNKVIYNNLLELYNSIDRVIDEKIDNVFEDVFPIELNILTRDIVEKKGESIDVNIEWTITQNNIVIVPDRIVINGEEIPPESTSKLYTNVTTDNTYKIRIYKNNHYDEGILNVSFINPKYKGNLAYNKTINNVISEDIIKGDEIINSNLNENLTYNLNNEKSFYAYPSKYGTISEISDKHDLDYINSYDNTNMTINGELYDIYILQDSTSINDFVQIFK